jgi:hypothetical protein
MSHFSNDVLSYLLVIPSCVPSTFSERFFIPIKKIDDLPSETGLTKSIICDVSSVSLMALQVVSEDFKFVLIGFHGEKSMLFEKFPNINDKKFIDSRRCKGKIIDANNMEITLILPDSIPVQKLSSAY